MSFINEITVELAKEIVAFYLCEIIQSYTIFLQNVLLKSDKNNILNLSSAKFFLSSTAISSIYHCKAVASTDTRCLGVKAALCCTGPSSLAFPSSACPVVWDPWS